MSKPTPFKYKKPNDSAGFLLWKITSLWQQEITGVLELYGINQTQFAIMASLKWFEEHEEETTQTHIVEHAKIEKMTVSKSIRNLEKIKLIKRRKSLLDARAVKVEFTKQGRKVIHEVIIAVEAADDAFFANLSASELKTYMALTLTIIEE